MAKSIIAQGRTTEEAIQNGLKELNTTRDCVDINIIPEQTKHFFSILAPRVVKVEMTLKEERKNRSHRLERISIPKEQMEKAKNDLEMFLDEFSKLLDVQYDVVMKASSFEVNFEGVNIGFLIGYRGETLDSIQNILSSVINKGETSYIKITVDCGGYRPKREKTLESLAKKMAQTTIRTGKSISLEPMNALERKIIHSTLQDNTRIKTTSVGRDPNRYVVISLK